MQHVTCLLSEKYLDANHFESTGSAVAWLASLSAQLWSDCMQPTHRLQSVLVEKGGLPFIGSFYKYVTLHGCIKDR